jgi:hypothetical protein
LTHFTPAPQTFAVEQDSDKPSQTGDIFRRVCRWSDAYRWISQFEQSATKDYEGGPKRNFLVFLVGEFSQFLEEERMNVTETKNDDLELMRGFFSRGLPRKMRDLMGAARSSVAALPALVSAGQYGKARALLDKENPLVWDWVYCFEQNLKWFVSWGVSGKDGLRAYKIELASPLKCFVLVGSDSREIPISSAQLQPYRDLGWSIYEPSSGQKLRLVKTVEPALLLEGNAGFNSSFEHWVTGTVNEAIALLGSARKGMAEIS